MYTLAFDTTSSGCSVALFSDNRCIDKFVQSMEFGQAEVLIPEIRNILKRQNISFSDLELLVVCTGPGSFTGVRSSISAARSFGLANPNLTVLGVNAFDAYIQELVFSPENIATINAVIIETKRDDFYYQLFDNKLQPLTEPSSAQRSDIIKTIQSKKVSFLGDGVERFLSSPTGLSIHSIINTQQVNIENLALKGISLHSKKIKNYPKPLYLRAPDVCIKS